MKIFPSVGKFCVSVSNWRQLFMEDLQCALCYIGIICETKEKGKQCVWCNHKYSLQYWLLLIHKHTPWKPMTLQCSEVSFWLTLCALKSSMQGIVPDYRQKDLRSRLQLRPALTIMLTMIFCATGVCDEFAQTRMKMKILCEKELLGPM